VSPPGPVLTEASKRRSRMRSSRCVCTARHLANRRVAALRPRHSSCFSAC